MGCGTGGSWGWGMKGKIQKEPKPWRALPRSAGTVVSELVRGRRGVAPSPTGTLPGGTEGQRP